MTQHNHITAALAPPGECPACDEKYAADPKLRDQVLTAVLTYPHQGMLGPPEQAKEEAAKLIEQGCLAWVVPEYGPDMGIDNVYWGHRVYYFEAEERADVEPDVEGRPSPIDQEIKEELYLITLALESLVSTVNKVMSFTGGGEEERDMSLRVLRSGRANARAILKD